MLTLPSCCNVEYPAASWSSRCVCDVRDVAHAHILVYQKVERDGAASFPNRVMIISACPNWTEIAAQIAVSVPASHAAKVVIPTEQASEGAWGAIPPFIKFDCAAARAIGLPFTRWEKTISDMVADIVAHGDLA
jgi:hypothetical protein